MTSPVAPVVFRFGEFELDLGAYELRRQGRRVKLGRQPMDLLILLVQRPRQLVSRTEIAERLWGPDVFVDIETGVNTAISKVRQALRDTADRPAYVETVAGRGYRFIAPIDILPAPVPTVNRQATPQAPVAATQEPSRRWRAAAAAAAIGLVAGGLALGTVWRARDGGSGPHVRTTIAVLPFANAAHDPEQDYLALGLTDETSASLAQIDPGRVIVKGRTGRYKGTTKSVSEIGQELGVEYLVDGTVRAEGGRLRVTTTLIRVGDQEHVWSQAYDREITSALALQQDVSAAIAGQIRARLSSDAAGVAVNRQTAVPEAYDAYLRGRFLQSRRTADSNRQAIEAYRRAAALDPNYALAWSSLAFTYGSSILNADARPADGGSAGPRRRRSGASRQSRAGRRAAHGWLPGLDPGLGLAGCRATAAAGDRARPWSRRRPSPSRARLSQAGRAPEAGDAMARARELDPLDPLSQALSSQVAFQGRDGSAAVRHARQAILIDPTFWIGHIMLGQAHAYNGQTDLALEALADATRLSGGNSKALSFRGYVLARTGRLAEAHEILRLLEARSKERYVPPVAFALIHAGLGDGASAFAWLDKAYAERDSHLMYLTVDEKWDPYRADPRFQALLARCGFTAPAAAPAAR